MLSGLFYYLYDEVAFLALDNVASITHAVGNTFKRVVTILMSVTVFGNVLTRKGQARAIHPLPFRLSVHVR